MNSAYEDKLDGKIPEAFRERRSSEGRLQEQQVRLVLEGLNGEAREYRAFDARRILELANKSNFLYIAQDFFEKAKLLRVLLSNCSVDAVSVTPAYKYPFGLIAGTGKTGKWSALVDDFRTFCGSGDDQIRTFDLAHPNPLD